MRVTLILCVVACLWALSAARKVQNNNKVEPAIIKKQREWAAKIDAAAKSDDGRKRSAQMAAQGEKDHYSYDRFVRLEESGQLRRLYPYYYYPKYPSYNHGKCCDKKGCCDPPARIKRCAFCKAGPVYSPHYWGPVQANLAFKRYVGQSSYLQYWPYKATDGEFHNNGWGECAITSNTHKYPYIYVDLGREVCIESITLTGPQSYPWMLALFYLSVSNTRPYPYMGHISNYFQKDNVHYHADKRGFPYRRTYSCPTCGRYVIIQAHRPNYPFLPWWKWPNYYLSVCEIEVRGRLLANNDCC